MVAPIRYEPIGKCIYCGRNSLQLSDEHIIAEAIGGNFILPKASCHRCSKITTKLEGHCFRGTLGAFRAQTKAPSKRPKQRPSQYNLKIQNRNGKFDTLNIPIQDYPAFLILPKFSSVPMILSGETIDPEKTCDAWAQITNINLYKNLDAKIGFVPFHPSKWLRMLAKISHSYAVAKLGLNAFKPFLPKIILGHQSATLEYFGCPTEETPPAEGVGHRIELINAIINGNSEVKYLVVNLRLYEIYGAPQYHIVVGTIK